MDANLFSERTFVERTCDAYQSLVKRNLDLLGELEGSLKWISYIVSSQSKTTSPVFSELLYTSSNILLLINESVIRKATIKNDIPPAKLLLGFNEDHFRFALTLINYLEVFIEISCLRAWGFRGKWLAITVVQLCKLVLRLILLVKQRIGFLFSPPIPPLSSKQRKLAQEQLKKENENSQVEKVEKKFQSNVNMTFTLKRSGRTIRTISAAPTALGRSWKVPEEGLTSSDESPQLLDFNVNSTHLDQTKFYAEILHIIRPVAHLLALRLCGQGSWKPWVMGLGMDVTSLRLIGDPNVLNRFEKAELRLRSWGLLYYLLRSPFFDKHTKDQILRMLGLMSKTIPGAKYICGPLVEYLPSWQKIYFYTWAN